MADPRRRRAENADGPWFVDDSCIDCGTCMWMAPGVFREIRGMSAVHAQPEAQDEDASAALLSCPTGSIGGPASGVHFPRALADGVWHCGYHDRRSFGAAAYLVQTDVGLVMVDVPRFVPRLVDAIDAMGGLHAIVLTHRDDVAEHDRWAKRFDVPRYIHEYDDVVGDEVLFGSGGDVAGLRWMHVPGHTRGSVVYQWRDVLFTGDHLAGRGERLHAFRSACWYDWQIQTHSMASLKGHGAARVLPGHGAPWHGTLQEFDDAIGDLVTWMAGASRT